MNKKLLKMSNGKKRCFKSQFLTKKTVTVKSNAMISPIVVLEKLPVKIEKSLFIKQQIIDSNVPNVLNHTDNKSRQQVKKNNLKYKKLKRKFTKFKKRNNSEKMIDKYNKNFAAKESENKLKNSFQFNSGLNKFPRVVLERSSVKIETNLYIDNEYFLHTKIEVDDKSDGSEKPDGSNNNDENIQKSTSEKAVLEELPEPENIIIKCALTVSEEMCNKIKNEIEDVENYLETGIKICDKESFIKIEKTEANDEIERYKTIVDESNEITEVLVNKKNIDNAIQMELEKIVDEDIENFVIKEDVDNNIQIEFESSVNENNEVTEVLDIKENVNNVFIEHFDNKEDADNIITEEFVNTEEIDDIEIIENENNLLCVIETPKKIFDSASNVNEKIDISMNSENFCNDVRIERNMNITLQEVCDQMENDVNSGLVNKWLIDESNSSVNFNSNSQLITETEVVTKDTRLFVFKCLKCNIIQPLNRTKLIVYCKICDSIMYHECLVCQKKYQSVYTMYSHMSRKHQVEKNIVNELKKNRSAVIEQNTRESEVKKLDNVTNYLLLVQYHDKRDAKILRTVPNPITAYCLDCHKQVSATDKTEKGCSTCKTKYIFLCNSCKYIRKNYGQIRLHVLRSHAKKILKCPYNCGKSFSYSRSHWDHVKSCQTFQSISNENKLTKMLSTQVKSYCYKCGQYFESKLSMLEHVNYCGNSNALSCEHCDFKTDSKNILNNHMQIEHVLLLF